MKVCPNCKKEYADDVEYCLEDGTVLNGEESAPTVLVNETRTSVSENKTETVKPQVKTSTAAASGGSSATSKFVALLAVILLIGGGLVFWKVKYGHSSEGLTKLTKQDLETIFADAPPQALQRLASDPELKKKQLDQIKEFLAVAQEARKNDFAAFDPKDVPQIKEDLEEIRMTITAVSYDKEINKDKENLPPFASITKEEVDAFFQKDGNQEKFDKLLNEQIEAAKKGGRIPEDFQIQPQQLEQAKDQYAKVRIGYAQAKAAWSGLSEDFKHKTELQIQLQESQYLEQKYSQEVIAKKVVATDEEIANYLTTHPEEAKVIEEKKAKAEELLKRAKAGEDFTKLVEEASEDPGSKKDGGLYKDVTKGAMVPEFEQAALALEPGQVADKVVESNYGFHIIKLEKKGTKKDAEGKDQESYDARHILISTMSGGDPANPMAPPMPLKEKIKSDIETEKKKKLMDDILARNPIEIAQDFEIKVPPMPEGQGNTPGAPGGLTPEQMEQLKKQIEEAQKGQKDAPKEAPKKEEKPKK